MSLLRQRLRSELPNLVETNRLLTKLQGLLAQSPRHIVFALDKTFRINAALCSDVVIDPTLMSGNIQFRRPPLLGTAGALTLQDLTYTGAAGDADDNAVTIHYLNYTAAVAASKAIQDITYTAVSAGSAGNSITVRYTTGATAGAEVVTVLSNAITVQIETGVSTATQVKAAFDASGAATALATSAISGTGSNAQTSVSATNLVGGSNSVGAAGSEVVSVSSQAITITLQSGVSTATQVKAAFDASGPATALASVAISGTGSNAQTAPVSATHLAGGITASAVESYDTADILIIRRLRTKKWLIDIQPNANPA